MAMIRRKFGGLEAQKFQFDIVIGEMRASSKLAGQDLNVCWTRGAKIASTAHVKCSEGGAATWNETLSLICTMYRSSNGKYQEKNAKLAVREKKKKKTVGKAHFDLGEYVSMQGSKQVTMPLEVSTGVFSANESSGALELTVNCRFIPPGDGGDYSEMTAMDASEMSTQSVESLEDEESEAPVPVSAPRAMNASVSASMGGASFADGLMEPSAAPHELVDKNKALTEEMEQLKKQLKKASDEAEDSAAEVKRLQKSNYALQDTLARQQNEGDEALCARISELEKQQEEEAASKATLERQVSDLNEQLEQAAAAAAAAAGARSDDEQTAQLITSLVEAKIAYANSEEEKGNMGLKLVQLRRALAKERELNQQVSQRMTRLEVKAEKLKQGQPMSPKNSTAKGGGK